MSNACLVRSLLHPENLPANVTISGNAGLFLDFH